MPISVTQIILIVLFALCGLVLLWAIKNGNNIKLKKKEKKQKTKKDSSEKFKDIIPKEKKEKKPKLNTIRQAVKDEKKNESTIDSNKIMKVTKEDFKSNDLNVPKALEDKTPSVEKAENKNKPFNPSFSKSSLPKLDDEDDLWLRNKLKEFDLPELDDELPPIDLGGFDKNFKDFDFPFGQPNLNEFDNKEMFAIEDRASSKPRVKGEIKNESIEERINKVFGTIELDEKAVKEVVVGEVLSNNRSRINRESRTRRAKWLK